MKILRVLPFAVLFVFTVTAWYGIYTDKYWAGIKDYINVTLVIINLVLYFFRFRMGILLTGVILLLATFHLIVYSNTVSVFYFSIGRFHSPKIQPWSLLLLVVFLVLNAKHLLRAFNVRVGSVEDLLRVKREDS